MTINVTNPFSVGYNEGITDDKQFLALFEHSILEAVPWTTAFSKSLVYWLSAEGAGKSTILRIFTPSLLRTLASEDESNPLVKILMRDDIDALTSAGPRILGIQCKCTLSYAYLNDVVAEPNARKRLFYALLNSRVVLRGLKGYSESLDLRYPEQLGLLTYDFGEDAEGLPPDLPIFGSGAQLREWARNVERTCLEAIDAGLALQTHRPPQHDFFAAQLIMDPRYWSTTANAPLPVRAIVMLDDGQDLTEEQREWLNESVTREREGCHVWVAQRLYALDTAAQFAGADRGREFDEIRLESVWKEGNTPKQQRDYLIQIGAKRIRKGQVPIKEYRDILQERPDPPTAEGRKVRDKCVEVTPIVNARLREATRGTKRYDKWIMAASTKDGTAYEKLVELRHVEIIIERGLQSSQSALIDEAMPIEQLRDRMGADTRYAAQAFLAHEFGLPLYFGQETMAYLASNNVRQFLHISEKLYDEAIGRVVRQLDPAIPCTVQDDIVKSLADARWDEIGKKFIGGQDLRRLLEIMIQRLSDEFQRGTAPYPPAPVGISIPLDEYKALQDGRDLSPSVAKIRELLSRCLSANLLSVEDRQDKSEPVKVFFLNGLVLAKHRLPVSSRHFQPSRLDQLAEWYEKGYQNTKKPRGSMAGKKRKPRDTGRRPISSLDGFMQDTEREHEQDDG